MNILESIIANKKLEIRQAKLDVSVGDLEKSHSFGRSVNSLVASLSSVGSSGIIAEFKRKSPSKGVINSNADIIETSIGYADSGAACISVLTDTNYFGGYASDLQNARANTIFTPLLRKDFIIDDYQIYEAKAWGADVILLIAANLESEQIASLSKKAHELGLEVLLEVHNKEEIDKSPMDAIDVIGVNNRNLKNFSENNVNSSIELFEYIPKNKIKISESCIAMPETVKMLRQIGYQGFLMGENFMKTNNPALALKNFISQLK